MFEILGAVFRRFGRRIKEYTAAISKAIDEGDDVTKLENVYGLLAYFGIKTVIWAILAIIFAIAGLFPLYWKLSAVFLMCGIVAALSPEENSPPGLGIGGGKKEVFTPEELEQAKADAEMDYADVRSLIFNSILDTVLPPESSIRIKPPRSENSIERNTEDGAAHFRMAGLTAIYQFEIDIEGKVTYAAREQMIFELQRYVTKYVSRYEYLNRQNRAPMVLDIKSCGNFVLVEVVLYSEAAKKMVDCAKSARYKRRQQPASDYDLEI